MGQPGCNSSTCNNNSGWGDGESDPEFLSCKDCNEVWHSVPKDCVHIGSSKKGRMNGCVCMNYDYKNSLGIVVNYYYERYVKNAN